MAEATEAGTGSNAQQGPPATFEFALDGKRLVRYNRMARSGDADAAVLGKGGFGCVYRYAIDTSFTPPSSMDLSMSLHSAGTRRQGSGFGSSASAGSQRGREVLYPSSKIQDVTPSHPGMKPPSLVAVKLCRTPCSGSFDELQKTSLVDKKTRRAEMQDDSRMHVRIVRGEGRIFQYLQAARQASSRTTDPPLVKLLANLSPNGSSRGSQPDSMDISSDEEDGPPTRLLVFEKLIELDADRTAQGWVKSKKTWTHERVEKVALEVMQGLQFLHEHNVTHGDLKPSNLMLDPRTGIVKIIDLGASRRFVHLSNMEHDNRRAVEEQDRLTLALGKPLPRLAPGLCEGLGSLTGSPYYMAPEILLQATRYVDITGRARSVLEDYEYDYPSFLAREQWSMYQIGLSDLRRGWGIRADIWSWACTVQALLLKTVDEEQRPSSSTISPYDFSFSRHRDEMIDPLYEKSPGEDDVPRFHQWCRVLPLLIVRIALEPVPLIPQADTCSPALRFALKASLRHQDLRPTADEIQEALEAAASASARMTGTRPHTGDNTSSRPTSYQHLRRQSQLGAASEASGSPQTNGCELETSTYATPPLSHGASSVSTPQQTCEMGGRTGLERTPESDPRHKVRFDTMSAESGFSPTPADAETRSSVEAKQRISDPVPQGFELVSPSRTPKLRSKTLGEAPRPATAGASLQSYPILSRSSNSSSHLRPAGTAGEFGSYAATTSREALHSRPMTSPQMDGSGHGRGNQGSNMLQQGSAASARQVVQGSGKGHNFRSARNAESLRPPTLDGLGISVPLQGMHGLQLRSPTLSHRSRSGAASVPASPMAHVRGASMPMFGREEEQGMAPRVLSPINIGNAMPMSGENIGGFPRCSTADGKGAKAGSLMATLKEKQVRLKQSSRKLMGRRANGVRSSHGVGEEGSSGFGDDRRVHFGEMNALQGGGMRHGQARTANVGYGPQDDMMVAPESSGRCSSARSWSTGYGGSSSTSRRTGNKASEEGSPTKPLLKRLLTWSNTPSSS